MKSCSTCLERKSFEHFYPDSRYKDGYRGQCRACVLTKCREYAGKPKNKARKAEQAKHWTRKPYDRALARDRLYGLAPGQFEAMVERQGGKCAVCGTTEPGGGRDWHVDHDHSCCPGNRSCGACVRGLLCGRCNPMLGMARDDIAVLQAAVDYLTANALLNAIKSPT